MMISSQVHLIRNEFNVTPEVKRYVNIYLIVGKYCYLVDSGVSGSSDIIGEYLKSINRELKDIKGIFLTHSHPDHIGAAAEIKKQTGCKIYAPVEEIPWIENIQTQFSERPIPNFYNLVSESVEVSRPLMDGDVVEPEEGIRICALSTKGHSHDSMSFILNDEVIFTGDAIPVADDLPIFVNYEQTIKSLDLIQNLYGIKYFCPAWDNVYDKSLLDTTIENSKEMLLQLKDAAVQVEKELPDASETDRIIEICKRTGMQKYLGNPLFSTSIRACCQRK
ncbi:MAG: MBL fold metallo-hydrolase [Wujia sp.]